jgi:DNA-binding MarR family transcriptional regulator
MNDKLKQDLTHSIFRFKKISAVISHTVISDDEGGLSISELSALGCIDSCGKNDCSASEQTTHHAMHETLAVSKPAVSQMLGSLEKREYIQREIDHDNRRKIIITLTPKGRAAIDKAKKNVDNLMSLIITRFGEKDSRNFVRLLDRFEKVMDEALGVDL